MSVPKFKKVYCGGELLGEVPSRDNFEEDMATARALIAKCGLSRETTLFEAMLLQAIGFGRAAAHLHDRDLLNAPRNVGSAPAFIANSAFAIELYLKALAEKHAHPLGRGHKLRELYDALPVGATDAIDRAFPASLVKRHIPAFSLPATLDSLNDAFVNWRYSYEHTRLESPSLEHIIVVVQTLHAACHEHGT